jgi:hypothetical protein
MLLVWLAVYFFYFVGPINLDPGPSLKGSFFIFFSIIVFILGSLPLTNKKTNSNRFQLKDSPLNKCCISKVDNLLMFIGIIGLFLLIVEKLTLLNEFNFISFSELRSDQAKVVKEADFIDHLSSPILKIGFLLYPAGFVASVSFWLNFEFIKPYQKIMFFIFVSMIIFLNIISGQRSIFFVCLLLILIAGYVRTFFTSFIPRNKFLQLVWALTLLFFIVYVFSIFEIRSNGEDLSLFSYRMNAAWGTIVKPEWISLLQTLFSDETIKSVVSSFSYFLQNLSVTEKILSLDNPQYFYGAYSIDIISSFFRMFQFSTDYLQTLYIALFENHIYGFFSGAWSGTYLDFGFFAYLIFFLWGRLSGMIYRNVRDVNAHYSNVLFVIVLFLIMISPISSPFGFSNSFITIFWAVIYAFLSSRHQFFLKR